MHGTCVLISDTTSSWLDTFLFSVALTAELLSHLLRRPSLHLLTCTEGGWTSLLHDSLPFLLLCKQLRTVKSSIFFSGQ